MVLSFYANKVTVETDDSVSSRVTVEGVDAGELVSEAGATTLLNEMDISDIEAYLKQYLDDQRDEA